MFSSYHRVSEELKDAASAALKESGVEFIASMNMYFNKNTGKFQSISYFNLSF